MNEDPLAHANTVIAKHRKLAGRGNIESIRKIAIALIEAHPAAKLAQAKTRGGRDIKVLWRLGQLLYTCSMKGVVPPRELGEAIRVWCGIGDKKRRRRTGPPEAYAALDKLSAVHDDAKNGNAKAMAIVANATIEMRDSLSRNQRRPDEVERLDDYIQQVDAKLESDELTKPQRSARKWERRGYKKEKHDLQRGWYDEPYIRSLLLDLVQVCSAKNIVPPHKLSEAVGVWLGTYDTRLRGQPHADELGQTTAHRLAIFYARHPRGLKAANAEAHVRTDLDLKTIKGYKKDLSFQRLVETQKIIFAADVQAIASIAKKALHP